MQLRVGVEDSAACLLVGGAAAQEKNTRMEGGGWRIVRVEA
jgi:hypothetical protein